MREESGLEFLGAEAEAVALLRSELVDARTGLYSFSVFMQFVELEFYRFEAYHVPFSVILFELAQTDSEPMPVEALTAAALRMKLVLRDVDVIGHAGSTPSDFGILLPGLRPAQSLVTASKALQALTASCLAPGLNKRTLRTSFGVAGLPEDGNEIDSLIRAALQARHDAEGKPLPVSCARGADR